MGEKNSKGRENGANGSLKKNKSTHILKQKIHYIIEINEGYK